MRIWTALILAVLAVPANAQIADTRAVVISDGPSSVSVTIYRNPNRNSGNAMNLSYLGGYALITEQRTVYLPVGEIDIRFEGVAGGIIPQSAIITGTPESILEKNRDAALLSPSAMLNNYLGRGVTIRRTKSATGETSEFTAQVRTDASGGMIIQSAQGFEALRCTGLSETIVYPSIPKGLSAKPTLSVKSRVLKPTRATLTLSYLATGFDWQANYVADVSADGTKLNLFSWMTLANSDETSFLNAQTQAVAGQPNKGRDNMQRTTGGAIALRCWPQATTSDIMLQRFERARQRRNFSGLSMPEEMMAMQDAGAPVIVTAQKIKASQEELGDLKLYRIPVPVTVASQSQKQVAFLEKSDVPFVQIYETEIWADDTTRSQPLAVTLRFQNKQRDRLGVPLPAGKFIAFKQIEAARLLLGEGSLDDKAVDEEVEVTINDSPLVRYQIDQLGESDSAKNLWQDMALTVTNASKLPATVEISLDRQDNEKIKNLTQKLGRKDGKAIWRVTVAPNSERILKYRVVRK